MGYTLGRNIIFVIIYIFTRYITTSTFTSHTHQFTLRNWWHWMQSSCIHDIDDVCL